MHQYSGRTARAKSHGPHGRTTHVGILAFCLGLALLPVHGSGGAGRRTSGHSSLAANGKIAFYRVRDHRTQVYVMDADGQNQLNLTNDDTFSWNPAWSPDGNKIVYAAQPDCVPDCAGTRDIWVMNADGSGKTRLYSGSPEWSDYPAWSPDGSRIAFVRGSGGSLSLRGVVVVMRADGTNPVVLNPTSLVNGSLSWSADNTKIACYRANPERIWVMNADGTNATQITNFAGLLTSGAWSPDGTKIAVAVPDFKVLGYIGSEIYIMNPDGTGQTRLTTATGDSHFSGSPAWSPDGTRIAFDRSGIGSQIFVMNADGSNQVALTSPSADSDHRPAWQPLPSASMQLSSADYNVSEGAGSATITVTRTGNTSGSATVDYATTGSMAAAPCANVTGLAAQNCDYTFASGTLAFGPGESSKDFVILINDDAYVEGNETLSIALSNPTGGATLGGVNTSTLTILDNDSGSPTTNPLDDAQLFVRQHYYDFLNRVPDSGGLAFWTNEITSCGSSSACIEVKRINVSAAYFLSIEFQETEYLVYRCYNASLDRNAGLPRYLEFMRDTQEIGRGVIVNSPGWEQLLEANKVAFATKFVQRSEFTALYPTTMTPMTFVDALYAHAQIMPSASDRTAAIAEFGTATNTTDTAARGRVLRRVAEDSALNSREYNRAFVLMQYFGYLRRNPDDAPDNNLDGYNFWLNKLNQFGGNFINAEMVKAFIVSSEYRQRFGS